MRAVLRRRIFLTICALMLLVLSACDKTCGVEGCKNKAIAGQVYCEEHTCAAENCYQVVDGGEYCKEHTCLADMCVSPKIEKSEYCQQHTCSVEGCFEKVKSGSTYCKKHSCANDLCSNAPIEGSAYCEDHTCIVDGCFNKAKFTKSYCTEHGCKAATCKNQHIAGSAYCEEHTCKAENCTEEAVATKGYCSKHLAEVKQQQRQAALATMKKDYDKVQGVTWYQSKNFPTYINTRSYVLPYIGVSDSGSVWLRIQFNYTGDDWVFFKNIIVSVDGQNYYKSYNYYDIVRNNGSGDVWEYIDVQADSSDIEMLRAIANSKETIVRFQGDDYHSDLTVKSTDKLSITEVLNAYELLKAN